MYKKRDPPQDPRLGDYVAYFLLVFLQTKGIVNENFVAIESTFDNPFCFLHKSILVTRRVRRKYFSTVGARYASRAFISLFNDKNQKYFSGSKNIKAAHTASSND